MRVKKIGATLFLLATMILSACASTAATQPEAPAETAMAEKPGDAAKPEPEASAEAIMEKEGTDETMIAEEAMLDHAKLLDQLLFSISSQAEGRAILSQIAESGDTGFVAGLIEIIRFQPGLSQEIGATLNALTGQDLPPDWFDWVEWAGQHPELESFPGFTGWKATLLAQIDPEFQRFIYEGVKVAPGSRVEEIQWGGVMVDGIPALDNPRMIDPAAADYLVPTERVFGISLNGDSRAYPARFLDWHEMFNDVIGGQPVSLAY